jgi:hypothetical protein
VWSGRELGGLSMFFFSMIWDFCVWPGMVLNQRQLSIVVPDWEPYVGSLFCCGWIFSVSYLYQTELFRFHFVLLLVLYFSVLSSIKENENLPARWSSPSSPQTTVTVNHCIQWVRIYIHYVDCAFKQLGKFQENVMALEASERLIDIIWVNWRCTCGCISRSTFKLSASLLDIMEKSK